MKPRPILLGAAMVLGACGGGHTAPITSTSTTTTAPTATTSGFTNAPGPSTTTLDQLTEQLRATAAAKAECERGGYVWRTWTFHNGEPYRGNCEIGPNSPKPAEPGSPASPGAPAAPASAP